MATLPIGTIEDALAERGLDTQFTGMDHGTSYIITGGSTEVEILDGVSGDFFRAEDVAEVIVYGDSKMGFRDATPEFESVETVEEFLKAVAEIFA